MIAPHPPDFYFGRQVNPFSIRGAYYAHHTTTPPSPRFSDLPVVLIYITQGGEGEEANLETQTTLAGISI